MKKLILSLCLFGAVSHTVMAHEPKPSLLRRICNASFGAVKRTVQTAYVVTAAGVAVVTVPATIPVGLAYAFVRGRKIRNAKARLDQLNQSTPSEDASPSEKLAYYDKYSEQLRIITQ